MTRLAKFAPSKYDSVGSTRSVGSAVHLEVPHDLLVGVARRSSRSRARSGRGTGTSGMTATRPSASPPTAIAMPPPWLPPHDRDARGIDHVERPDGVDRAHRVGEDAAVVVVGRVVDAAGHEAGRRRSGAVRVRVSPAGAPAAALSARVHEAGARSRPPPRRVARAGGRARRRIRCTRRPRAAGPSAPRGAAATP